MSKFINKLIYLYLLIYPSLGNENTSLPKEYFENINKLSFYHNVSEQNSKLRDVIIDLGKSQSGGTTHKDIRFEKDKIIIETNCRRTNIQSTLIKTYWLCGYTLSKMNLFFPNIIVILHISQRNNILITSVNGVDALDLANNKISDYQYNKNFLNKINVYTQNNN